MAHINSFKISALFCFLWCGWRACQIAFYRQMMGTFLRFGHFRLCQKASKLGANACTIVLLSPNHIIAKNNSSASPFWSIFGFIFLSWERSRPCQFKRGTFPRVGVQARSVPDRSSEMLEVFGFPDDSRSMRVCVDVRNHKQGHRSEYQALVQVSRALRGVIGCLSLSEFAFMSGYWCEELESEITH